MVHASMTVCAKDERDPQSPEQTMPRLLGAGAD
jgi:hypothetical protein